jgi:DNA-binding IclR family transcriptional regulator
MSKGLSEGQTRLLRYLNDKSEPVEFAAVHDAVGLSTPGNTLRALKALEKRGYANQVAGEPLYRPTKLALRLMGEWKNTGVMPDELKRILEGTKDD